MFHGSHAVCDLSLIGPDTLDYCRISPESQPQVTNNPVVPVVDVQNRRVVIIRGDV